MPTRAPVRRTNVSNPNRVGLNLPVTSLFEKPRSFVASSCVVVRGTRNRICNRSLSPLHAPRIVRRFVDNSVCINSMECDHLYRSLYPNTSKISLPRGFVFVFVEKEIFSPFTNRVLDCGSQSVRAHTIRSFVSPATAPATRLSVWFGFLFFSFLRLVGWTRQRDGKDDDDDA